MSDHQHPPQHQQSLADLIVTTSEYAALAGVCAETIRAWTAAGQGPKPFRRIGRNALYDRRAVSAFLGTRAANA